MTLYCCHNLLTGNDNFYDSWYISLRVKDKFKHSSNVTGHEIILQAHFVEEKYNF